MPARPFLRTLALSLLLAWPLAAQQGTQKIDTAYTRQIGELTPTHPVHRFTTELVDYLPASATVPTPLAVLGYVPGTIGRLSNVADVNKYFRALADASPRVKLMSLGTSDEGREMLVVAIAEEATIRKVDEYRRMLVRLSDPRGLAGAERDGLMSAAKPIYWLTGALHSPETGSPEMLMELAYRLAVDEGETVQKIRENVITLITPILEVDGRDRVVDAYRLSKSLGLGPQGVPLAYWGKYTAHDNNRDAMVLSQRLTRAFTDGFLHWRPTVTHDLHESVPFLYTSTGTGPYNDEFDAIVVDEWHKLAYEEINELTRRGLPGVWTHGFYDGWTPNYLLAFANLHNSIGRFYETFTSMGADCHTVKLPPTSLDRRWYRANPPVNGVRWCIRSNINYQQSGVLIALRYVADHRKTFITNQVAKAERMVQRGRTSAPYAYVIPRRQQNVGEAVGLVNLFRRHGAEVHQTSEDYWPTPKDGVPRDSVPLVRPFDWIIRMDQPYTASVRTLLSIQKFKADDPPPYDDTGWTLDLLRHVETKAITDSGILAHPMTLVPTDVGFEAQIAWSGSIFLVRHEGDWRSAAVPWKVTGGQVNVAEEAFEVDGMSYPAGTFILTGLRGADRRTTAKVLGEMGVGAMTVHTMPDVRHRRVTAPRIAYVHSWLETQNEGWVRFVLDKIGIPYTYMSDQELSEKGALDRYDVVLFPHVRGSVQTLLNGRPKVGPAIPWKKTALTPNLGKLDETDDMRIGLGLEGAAALRRFVERGGLLVTEGGTSLLPVELGFNQTVSVSEPRGFRAPGAVFRAQMVEKTSPVLYGYSRTTFPVYFNQAPLLSVSTRDTMNTREPLIDTAIVNETERMRARVILRFHSQADSLLMSGLLVGASDMAGKAAVIDAPVGRGHVVMFAIRPMWRYQTQGSFALVLNAMANWNNLDPRPATDGKVAAAASSSPRTSDQ
jgi:hypothetical protein